MRVQIPAYTDRWMMGDRYGDVVKVTKKKSIWRFGVTPSSKALTTSDQVQDIAHVKLDISGKTLKFLLDDCTVV
jgi:myo-inositol-hexaphosphate 3-phosphohydrolase